MLTHAPSIPSSSTHKHTHTHTHTECIHANTCTFYPSFANKHTHTHSHTYREREREEEERDRSWGGGIKQKETTSKGTANRLLPTPVKEFARYQSAQCTKPLPAQLISKGWSSELRDTTQCPQVLFQLALSINHP